MYGYEEYGAMAYHQDAHECLALALRCALFKIKEV